MSQGDPAHNLYVGAHQNLSNLSMLLEQYNGQLSQFKQTIENLQRQLDVANKKIQEVQPNTKKVEIKK